MAVPTNRESFKMYCLRKLGYPVIEINVDDDQIEDRIDESLRYYWDYHFDGSEKVYYKHKITQADRPGAAKSITVVNGGTGYSNTDTIIIDNGVGAEGTVVTNNSGVITSVNLTQNGIGYSNTDLVSVDTTTGVGAELELITGDGSIELPENIIGAVRVFPIADPAIKSDDMFNIRYQIALNDLYSLTSVSMIPYYMAMEHLALISELLVGQKPIRYTRHRNKLNIDMEWVSVSNDEYLLIEAYEVINPEVYPDVWADRWLQNYCTAKIKYQWGSNLTKFIGSKLPGGVEFNGEKIFNDADKEIKEMEDEMLYTYSLPVSDFFG